MISLYDTSLHSPVMSEHASFHRVLEESMDVSSGSPVAVQCQDVVSQAHLAQNYAKECDALAVQAAHDLSTDTAGIAKYSKLVDERRLERDTWSLCDILLRSDLMKDISDAENDVSLEQAFEEVCVPRVSLQEVLECGYSFDERIKRSRVVLEWLERAAEDCIHVPPVNTSTWDVTLNRILNGRSTSLKSVHPDAQLRTNTLCKLEGNDAVNQLVIWNALWSCVRAGDVLKAQQIAAEQGLMWMSSMLMGAADEYYETENTINRMGNCNKQKWIQTAWKYAHMLYDGLNRAQCNGTDDIEITKLECTIVAALCGCYDVLSKSSLLSSWSDQLYAIVKCSHDRLIGEVVSKYHSRREENSVLFRGCNTSNLNAQATYLQNTETLSDIWYHNAAALSDMLEMHCCSDGVPTNAQLYKQLQLALIQGRSSLGAYISNTLISIADEPLCDAIALNREPLLRFYSHFLIWLKFSCEERCELAELVSNKTLYAVLEQYILLLQQRSEYDVIALFASYLGRSRRVHVYSEVMSAVTGDDEQSKIVLSQAQRFFGVDVDSIVDRVVQMARTDITIFADESSVLDVTTTLADSTVHREGFKKSIVSNLNDEDARHYSSLSVIDNDRLSRLLWLCYRDEQRVAAVAQANAFIRTLLVESAGEKSVAIRAILRHILPPDSVEVGDMVLKTITDRLSSERGESVANLECAAWEADVLQLQFWYAYDSIMKQTEEWNAVVREAEGVMAKTLGGKRVLQSSVGRFKHHIEKHAAKISQDIEAALRGDYNSASTDIACSGYRDIWMRYEITALQKLHLLVQEMMHRPQDVDDAIGESTAELHRNIVTDAALLWSDDAVPPMWVDILVMLEQMQGTNIAEALTAVRDTLRNLTESKEVCLHIGYICKDHKYQVCQLICGKLLQLHVHVCSKTASVIRRITDEASAGIVWSKMAVRLSELLADGDPSLQLYSILHGDDLKSLLGKIHGEVVKIVSVEKEFKI